MLGTSLRLGLLSFGGPVAHLGYFRDEFVERKRLLTDEQYAELVAVAQFLPGPASSQVGMAVGYHRAGWTGAVAAWAGFTLPSALVMALFGWMAVSGSLADTGWVSALKLVAVAIVADAVWQMGSRLSSTPRSLVITVAATVISLVLAGQAWAHLVVLTGSALIGWVLFRGRTATVVGHVSISPSRRAGWICLLLFAALFVSTAWVAGLGVLGRIAAATYQAGSLVFGGGHVVLPLLEPAVVPDLLGEDAYLAGYGLANAMPGPLFTFGTYVGQVAAGPAGALVATIAIFLPGALLMFGALAFWGRLSRNAALTSAMVGLNAAVVGILAAAWISPVVSDSVDSPVSAGIAVVAFLALRVLHWPPPAVLLLGAGLGLVLL